MECRAADGVPSLSLQGGVAVQFYGAIPEARNSALRPYWRGSRTVRLILHSRYLLHAHRSALDKLPSSNKSRGVPHLTYSSNPSGSDGRYLCWWDLSRLSHNSLGSHGSQHGQSPFPNLRNDCPAVLIPQDFLMLRNEVLVEDSITRLLVVVGRY